MWPFPARRQHNSAILDVGVQGITCPNVESAAERTGKNDLPFGGNLGLHGKTILPDFTGILNRPTTPLTGERNGVSNHLLRKEENFAGATYRWPMGRVCSCPNVFPKFLTL